ncbi:MAG TPA: CheR family methyltransferase, partial [Gemmataceae bacterium]|nr:CheR family methyltransferase [Gemmataceae bacterium]
LSIALDAMLVGVTSLFRDPPVFDILRDTIACELARGRSGLTVWSAGCSDGAELYSTALLLAEQGLLFASYLLGTDCRPVAIEQAKKGSFDPLEMRNVPTDLRNRYFHLRAGRWEVVQAVRSLLRWKVSDLLRAPEPGIWDVILCRNTTMYMRTEMLDGLWERFEQGLRPGGVLVLGKAERPAKSKRLVALGPCLYRRTR